MRVTQSMLSNNTLRHMSNSYQKMGTIQDQFATGKKISRASQDPVVAMNGMRYRTQVTEVVQFKRNLGEVYNWMDTADATLDKVTQTLHRIRELTVQASNDTYEESQRANISKEISQLREHLVALGNTRANNKYIFNGTNTTTEPINMAKMDLAIDNPNFLSQLEAPANLEDFNYDITFNGQNFRLSEVDGNERIFTSATTGEKIIMSYEGASNVASIEHEFTTKDLEGNEEINRKPLSDDAFVLSYRDAVSVNNEDVRIEVLKGVQIPVNIRPNHVFSNEMFGEIIRLEKTLENVATKSEDVTSFLDNIDKLINDVVNERAELGARYNRIEMVETRVLEQEVIAKRILSDNEDADMEKVIIDLKTQENVHRAALATGARIIQPTLMDFLR